MRPHSASVGRQRTKDQMNKSFNDLVVNILDPAALRQQRMQDMKRKYDLLVEKVMFMDNHLPLEKRRYKYSSDTLMPYIYFFKYLAKRPYDSNENEQEKKHRLKLWIPDTIILNEKDCPGMWFYSSVDGHVYRTDLFVQRNVFVKFCEGSGHDSEIVGVIKKPQYKNLELVGNDVKPIPVSEMSTLSANLVGSRGDLTCLQRFVRCKGSKAFICRSVWKRSSNPVAWLITNKTDFDDTSQHESHRAFASASRRFSCTIMQCNGGRFVSETLPYVENIIKWMRGQFKVEFDEMACDFIRGIDNKWYFINVRGFLISKCNVPLYIKHVTHFGDEPNVSDGYQSLELTRKTSKNKNRIKPCKYCQIVFPVHELNQIMTLKMIMQTDLHLLHRGKLFTWVRQRVRFCHMDIPMLYHQYPVCQSCYTLYLACEDLIKLEYEFARKLGIQVSMDTRYNLVSVTHLDMRTKGRNVVNQVKANAIQGNGENFIMPEDWELSAPANSELLIQNNQPAIQTSIINQLIQYRMILILHSLNDIPSYALDEGNKYWIQFEWFSETIRYKLDFNDAILTSKGYVIRMNKMRMFYFFVSQHNDIAEFINQTLYLEMFLYENGEKIGLLKCELNDFKSDRVMKRDFYKQFTGKIIKPILSWGLNLSIGILDSGLTNIDNIKLQDFNGLYLPEPSYYTCEPLPQEWVALLKDYPNHRIKSNHTRARSFSYKKNIENQTNISRILGFTSEKKSFSMAEQDFHYTLEDQQNENEYELMSRQLASILQNEIRLYESDC